MYTYFTRIELWTLTVLKKDIRRVKGKCDVGEPQLGEALGEVEDLTNEFHLDGVPRRHECLHGEHAVHKKDSVLR